MKVIIVNGAYGYVPNLPNGKPGQYVVSVTRADGPIDVDPEEARRLVEGGIAQYAETVPFEEVAEENPALTEEIDLEAKTFAELKAYAQEIGIENIGRYRSKAALLEAIRGGDELPDLTPQDVVDE